jgi:2-oxoglutarate ferredoxin oxidoreductase subunit alpha
VLNPGGALDVAVALNWEDFMKFGGELPVLGSTIVLYEEKTGTPPDQLPLVGVTPAQAIAVPFADLAKKAAGTERAKNTVVLGLISGWFGLGRDALMGGIRKKLAKKGAELVEANERAFDAGVEFAKAHPLVRDMTLALQEKERKHLLLTDGNDMSGAAAIFAGCTFFGGYPITPSSEVMQFFSDHVWKYGGAVVQAEDEIAGIGTALGASFAGQKALTVTSGPGLSLKTEIMGLATIAELPLVIIDVQRGGPSTGLPTKSEQGDLFAAVFSAHGDVVRPVLAPTTVADTFGVTVEAFNLAEQYQTPVIILSDQEIAQRKEIVDPIDTTKYKLVERLQPTEAELQDYVRFRFTESGVSPISHPGMKGGNYLASGIEHNEAGGPIAGGGMHHKMNEKRFHKLEPLKRRKDLFVIEGNPKAPLGLISWGSSAGVCREALHLAQAAGIDAKLLVPYLLFPVVDEVYLDFFASLKGGIIVEQSYQGQLWRVLRMFLDVPKVIEPMCRSGANPFQPAEVVDRLKGVLKKIHGQTGEKMQPQE